MPDVSNAPAMPFESIGYSISSPPIQMEAEGSVLGNAQSAQEALLGRSPVYPGNFEATSSLISTTFVSVQELLLSVRAVF
jgi:hypothetical protein